MENEEQTGIKADWLREQIYFQNQICQDSLDCSKLRYVAGVDVAYTKIGAQEYGCCSMIIIDYNTLSVVQRIGYTGKVNVEYHPVFLSFRELPLVLENAKTIVMHCVNKESRIPIPTRLQTLKPINSERNF